MRLARFWFFVHGETRIVDVHVSPRDRAGVIARYAVQMLTMAQPHKRGDARLITGRYLPEAA